MIQQVLLFEISENPIVIKANGKIDRLINKINNKNIIANIGMGHTRWATHGNHKLCSKAMLYLICLIVYWSKLVITGLFKKNKKKDL